MMARYAHALADVKIATVCMFDSLDLTGFHRVLDSNWTPSPCASAAESEVNSLLLQHRPVAQLVRALP